LKALWAKRWLRYAVLGAAALFAVAAMALVGALSFVVSDSGARFAQERLQGRDLGAAGTLRIEGLHGNLLASVTADRIALADADGVWLEFEDVALAWRPSRLLGGALSISELSAGSGTLFRTPRAEGGGGDDGGGPPGFEIRLDRLAIDRFSVAEDAFGRAATLRIEADGALDLAGGGVRLALEADETSRGSDRLSLRLESERGRRFDLDLDSESGPDGLLPALLGAPDGAGATLGADISGDLASGGGEARLAFGGDTAAEAEIAWDERALTADGAVQLHVWPALSELASRAGRAAAVSLRVDDFRSGSPAVRLSAEAPRLSLEATGADLGAGVPVRVALADLGAWSGGAIKAAAVRWRGDLRRGDGVWRGDGAAEIESFDGFRVRADRAAGPLDLAFGGGALEFSGALDLAGTEIDAGPVDSMTGESVTLALDGRYEIGARQLTLETLDAAGESLDAETRLSIDLGAGALELEGRARTGAGRQLLKAADAELQARFTVSRAGEGEPFAVTATGEARLIAFDSDIVGDLFDSAATFETALSVDASGRIGVERAILVSGTTELGAEGALDPESGYALDLEARAAGPVAAGPAEFAGVVMAAGEMTGPLDDPDLALTVFSDSLAAGGVRLTRPRAEIAIDDLVGALTMQASAEAESALGLATAQLRLQRRGESIALDNLVARVADMRAEGELSIGPGGPQAALTFAKSGEGASTFPGTAEGSLDVSGAGDRQRVSVTLTGANILPPGGELLIDSVSASAEGALDALDYDVEIEGSVRGVPASLSADGRYAREDQRQSLETNFAGVIGRLAFETRETVFFSAAGDRSELRGSMKVDDGEIDIVADTEGPRRRLRLAVRDTPITVFEALRAEPRLDGVMSAEAEIVNDSGALSGAADLSIRGASTQDAGAGENPIDLDLDGQIVDGALELTLDARDVGGLQLDASLAVPLRAADGFVPAAPDLDGALSGEASVSGDIRSLSLLMIGSEQRFEGIVDGEAAFSGTFGNPQIAGELSLEDGRFDDMRTGIVMREVAARASFENDRARVTGLEGRDGDGGRFSGGGEVRRTESGWRGDITARFEEFQVADRDDAEIEASGEVGVRIDPDQSAIEGDLVINRGEVRPPQAAPQGVATIEVTEINKPGAPDAQPDAGAQTADRGPLTLDIAIRAPRRLFVRTSNLNVELSLDTEIKGTAANATVFGTASIVRGDVTIAGQRFNFEEGQIRFDGDPMAAEMDLVASRDTGSLTAIVEVTGTPRQPRIEIRSQPPLPEDEVLSRVLFGRSASQLSGLEAAQLAAALASLGGGGGFDALGEIRGGLGLDRLTVSSREGQTAVTGGRYLSDDVYLEVSSGGPDGPSAQIEWQALKNFSIISRFGSAETTSVSVRWRRDY